MKKTIPISTDPLPDKPTYCTECGTKLENFCFSEDADNLKAVNKHHEQCKKEDRFKGEQCSRIFISTPIDPLDLED
jgi:hypothetical protein